ncbi:MAG: response regulator [Thermodesulfobacteriota bacterium]|jgi:excisionase family DNA binding protein
MEQVLTLEEAAQYLKVAKPTLYRLLEDGKIPAFKVGNQWRFTKELIDKWLWDQLPKKKNVLVVDDEKLIAMDIKKIVTSEGHDVITTQSGIEASRAIEDSNIDLVFLDLVLPDMNGVEVLKEIKKAKSGLPVVIITGYPDSEIMNQALELGPISVLKKPFSRDQIRDLLKILLAPSTGSGRLKARQ